MMRIEEIGQVAAGAVDDQGVLREVIRTDGEKVDFFRELVADCLLYTSPSPRDRQKSRMPSSA